MPTFAASNLTNAKVWWNNRSV